MPTTTPLSQLLQPCTTSAGASEAPPNLLCHLLQALEGEVAFAALHSAHVGAVDAKNVCEGFLAQASLQPVGTQVPAHRLLEITNSHISQPGHLLLEGLQTDE